MLEERYKMKKQSRIQFVLLFTGIILILATYLYYPNLIKEETLETENVMDALGRGATDGLILA